MLFQLSTVLYLGCSSRSSQQSNSKDQHPPPSPSAGAAPPLTAPRCCSCSGCGLRSCPIPQPVLLSVPSPRWCRCRCHDALILATGSTNASKSSSSSPGIGFERLNAVAPSSWSFWVSAALSPSRYVLGPSPDAGFPFFLLARVRPQDTPHVPRLTPIISRGADPVSAPWPPPDLTGG